MWNPILCFIYGNTYEFQMQYMGETDSVYTDDRVLTMNMKLSKFYECQGLVICLMKAEDANFPITGRK